MSEMLARTINIEASAAARISRGESEASSGPITANRDVTQRAEAIEVGDSKVADSSPITRDKAKSITPPAHSLH